LELGRRAIPLPLNAPSGPLRRRIYQVARRLEADDLSGAEAAIEGLEGLRAADSSAGGVDLGLLRAEALCRVMVDLYEGGWEIAVEHSELFALAPFEDASAAPDSAQVRKRKDAIRRGMLARVRDLLSQPGAARLVDELEGPAGPTIRDLIASGPALAAALRSTGAGAIQPYLQTARGTDGDCPHTGLRLHSIFRYFRHLWSFPYGDTPGRSLPILIRDAGQPNHPICGLLCLASPILRLRVRDEELGLAPGWLEAMCAGLDPPARPAGADLRRHLRDHLALLERHLQALGAAATPAPRFGRVLEDLALVLGVPGGADVRTVSWRLAELGEAELEGRLRAARRGLLADLLGELRDAMRAISLEDLGVDEDQLLRSPQEARLHLLEVSEGAKQAWHAARASEQALRERWSGERGPDDAAVDRVRDRERDRQAELRALREDSNRDLFMKKRAQQLAKTLEAWSEVAELAPLLEAPTALEGADDVLSALRRHTSPREGAFDGLNPLSGGKHLTRALREALLLRKVRIAAAQIAEVSLCGAVPPYRELLGGKLAALLALSQEATLAWHDAYEGQRSEIQSQMSGETVSRPSELLALTTTSLFGVGSSQYNRLRLPPALGGLEWRHAGQTRGHGTLHFSGRTSSLMSALIAAQTGRRLITSTFGEGPSERLRKLRDGLKLLGLPEDELVRHGVARLVYVASLSPGTRPGAPCVDAPHHQRGATVAQIAEHWRDRWLAGRLQDAARLDALATWTGADAILSEVYAEELAVARRGGAVGDGPEVVSDVDLDVTYQFEDEERLDEQV
jgi:hypothetical protein